MRPIRLDALSPERLRELDELHHATRDVRVRTRARMVLLAAEQGLVAAEIAPVVRQDEDEISGQLDDALSGEAWWNLASDWDRQAILEE